MTSSPALASSQSEVSATRLRFIAQCSTATRYIHKLHEICFSQKPYFIDLLSRFEHEQDSQGEFSNLRKYRWLIVHYSGHRFQKPRQVSILLS